MLQFDHSKEKSLEACGITNDDFAAIPTTLGEVLEKIKEKNEVVTRCISYIIASKAADVILNPNVTNDTDVYLLISIGFISTEFFNNDIGKSVIKISELVEVVEKSIYAFLDSGLEDLLRVILFITFVKNQDKSQNTAEIPKESVN